MNFDFKITTWERVTVPEHMEQDIKAKIESGEITTANHIHDYCEEAETNGIDGVEGEVSLEDNGGFNTIEVMVDGDVIWGNGK